MESASSGVVGSCPTRRFSQQLLSGFQHKYRRSVKNRKYKVSKGVNQIRQARGEFSSVPELTKGSVTIGQIVQTANSKNDWLSDESIAAFMATVDEPEAALVG